MEFVVEHRESLPSVVHLTFEPAESLDTVIDALALAENAGRDASIWLHGTTPERKELFESRGLTSNRTLLQLRCPLPTPSPTIETRAFTELDLPEFVAVNNRAFEWHPEQSGLTEESARKDMATDWFNADGFRLHFINELAGFCWTKVHPEPDPVGEIYVIAVDPKFHGQGLGTQLTLAGLHWLHTAGLKTAMLYVESDNAPAMATYERIGFTTFRTDTLWQPDQ